MYFTTLTNMNNFIDQLMQQLGGSTAEQLSTQLKATPTQTQQGLEQFLPIMVEAMARNAQTESGATSLFNAAQKDHEGNLLDNLGGLLGSGKLANEGGSILGHVLGGKNNQVAEFISKSTGMSVSQATTMMQLAAPLVMSMLSRRQKQNDMKPADMSEMLRKSTGEVKQTDPKNMGMIERMLDRDGDGSVMDEVGEMGMSILKNWMSGRRQ